MLRRRLSNFAWLRRPGKWILIACVLASLSMASCAGGGTAGETAPSPPAPPPPSEPVSPNSVIVSPQDATAWSGHQTSFSANVQGTGNFDSAVEWMVDGVVGGNATVGTITSNGVYTGPATVASTTTIYVTAASVLNTDIFGRSSVTLLGTPTVTSVTPAAGAPHDEIQIAGTNFNYLTQTVAFTGPNGTIIATPTEATSGPTLIFVIVPLEAMTGPLFVEVPTGSGSFLDSNGISFSRIPDLRIRSREQDLGAGESTQFQVAIFGGQLPKRFNGHLTKARLTAMASTSLRVRSTQIPLPT